MSGAITFHDPEGREITLPEEQFLTLVAVMGDFERPVWHFNDCGCCISIHEHDDHPSWGYVIGDDGGIDRVEVSQRKENG